MGSPRQEAASSLSFPPGVRGDTWQVQTLSCALAGVRIQPNSSLPASALGLVKVKDEAWGRGEFSWLQVAVASQGDHDGVTVGGSEEAPDNGKNAQSDEPAWPSE